MKKVIQLLICCLGAFLVITNSFSQKGESTESIQELDSKLEEIFKSSDLTGISIVVVNDKEVFYNNSFGYADVATQKPYTNHTVHNIGSVSKTFIAAAIMKAQELGKLRLDDPINQYLPFQVIHPKFPDVPITLRHLAQHTSGISDDNAYLRAYVLENPIDDYSYLPDDFAKNLKVIAQNEDLSYAMFFENVLSKNGKWYSNKNFTKKAPGKRYNYSNIGAALAAYVVENATGVPFEQFTKQYIFDPLGMEKTAWKINDNNREEFASRYVTKNTMVPAYHLITSSDGGLITNTDEFGEYLKEIIRGRNGEGTILSKASYEEMFTRTEIGKESSGIFWGVNEKGTLNHSGSDPGVVSIAAINPSRNVGVFLMTNISADEDKQLMGAVLEIWTTLKHHRWE
ncbi:serine hydrolase domain-containing protein [Aquimarina hainanensis]|uniref:Serine hydrolase domain-containing protein n=1 Tax=Aquimarina hainanensis TaxID=1578017 RepID=A0ABW5N936_9FLAO